jgi:energy-coupling factor transport system permease protein
LVARGGRILAPSRFRLPAGRPSPLLNALALLGLMLVVGLRGQYGDL